MSEPLPEWSRARRDALSPDEVLAMLHAGNERFRTGQRRDRDYLAEQRSTAAGQWPAAVVLGCIDSRAPVEILFDAGIGHLFTARIAGNIVNADLVGSIEFACGVAGAKLVCVLGHTDCGAIKGAIAGGAEGSLGGLLRRIEPVVEKVAGDEPRSAEDAELVARVARENAIRSVEAIRAMSPALSAMEERGEIRIVGALYDVADGSVEFL